MLALVRGMAGVTFLAVVLCGAGCQDQPSNKGPKQKPTSAPSGGPIIPPIQNTGGGGAVMTGLPVVKREVTAIELRDVGTAYMTAAIDAAPQSVDAIARSISPKALAAIKDGTFIIFWGADPNQPNASNTVLGYVNDVPEKGGVVLMLDGTVRDKMTAEEFKAAPKGGKK